MTALESIATIFALLVLVKLVVVLINPQIWMKKVAEPLLGNPRLATTVYGVLAIVVGYYVLTRLYIVDVAAVMLFTALVGGGRHDAVFKGAAENRRGNINDTVGPAPQRVAPYRDLGRHRPLGPDLRSCVSPSPLGPPRRSRWASPCGGRGMAIVVSPPNH